MHFSLDLRTPLLSFPGIMPPETREQHRARMREWNELCRTAAILVVKLTK